MFKTITFLGLLVGVCYGQPTRIVGGVDTDITEIPYQVSLQYADGSDFHFCGGSILSEKWILTAGHCMASNSNPYDKQVVVGVTKLSQGGVKHTIKRAIRDSRYGSVHQYSHDIALLELNEPIKFNERAQPVKLPRDDQPLPIGKACTIQGWGYLSQGGESPDHLQSTTLPIWEPKKCAKAYRYDESLFVGPKAPMVCAGWPETYPDTCNGDSGGPLALNGVQYGIVSFGMGCANPFYPKVFTNVYNLRDFIHATTGLNL